MSSSGALGCQHPSNAYHKRLMFHHSGGNGPKAATPSFLGEIQLILGPMFSGKSTELLRRVRRFKYSMRKVLLIKYKKDTRYSEHAISTHDQDHIPANALDKLEEIDAEHWKQYDVIAIDEGQFFPDLADAIERFACQGKVVIVSALNGTFERRGFSAVMDAIPLADRIDHLTAVCASCGLEAPYSKRISNETDVEVIGSDDKYLPMCRRCFHGMTPNGDLENFNSVGYTTPTKHSREVLSDETNKGSDPKQQYRDRQDTPEQESVNTDPTLGTPTALNDL